MPLCNSSRCLDRGVELNTRQGRLHCDTDRNNAVVTTKIRLPFDLRSSTVRLRSLRSDWRKREARWQTHATSLEVDQGHRTWYHIRYGFLLACYSNFVPPKGQFWDIRLPKMSWPWNPGQRSLRVIGTDADRFATYDFLLTLHRNHGPISYRFRDKRRF